MVQLHANASNHHLETGSATHTHMSAALQDGSVKGGHLIELISGYTMEIVLIEEPTALYKKFDTEFEAALIDPDIK